MQKIYLDYAASTPVDPRVISAMQPYFSQKFGNPGSLHWAGQEAMRAVGESREKIAAAIGAEHREVIFTGSATEANNLVARGVAKGFRVKGGGSRPHIVVSAIEHESILETAKDLEREGFADVTYLPVMKDGLVRLEDVEAALRPETALVSIQYVNNETGTVEPISEISAVIRNFRKQSWPFFHTDAVQAFQFFDCRPAALGVDLMTISGHKIYGPKGVGALYVRSLLPTGHSLLPIITGGGQEYGLRSGTENVPLIVGFAKTVELAVEEREKRRAHVEGLHNLFLDGMARQLPQAHINSPLSHCSSHIINVSFPPQPTDFLLTALDRAGIAVSSGSACSSRSPEPSHVLKAVELEDRFIRSAVRFSFGQPTTRDEIKATLSVLSKIL